MATATAVRSLWECDTCRRPVEDGKGFVHVLDYEANRAAMAIEAWERAHPDGAWLKDILDAPQRIPWRVSHTACVPEEEWGYTWEIHRLRDVFGLMDFHFHVADKTWVADGTRLNGFTRAALDRFQVLSGRLPAPRLPED